MTEMLLPNVAAGVFPAVSDGITHQHQFHTALGRLLKFFLVARHPPTQRPVGGQGLGWGRQLLGRPTPKRSFMSGRRSKPNIGKAHLTSATPLRLTRYI